MELTYNPAIPLLGIYQRKTLNLKRYMHPYIHSNTIYSSKTWTQPKCASTDGRINKMWYTHNGILLSHKEQNNATCGNTDGSRDYIPCKVSHKEKDKYRITYMWNLNCDPNEHIYETDPLTNIEEKLVVAKGRGTGEGRIRSLGLADANYYYR